MQQRLCVRGLKNHGFNVSVKHGPKYAKCIKERISFENIHKKRKTHQVNFKLHNPVTCPVTLSTPTYTHNIDNTQLHTPSHMVSPENAQLHALRTHFLLTLNYTRA